MVVVNLAQPGPQHVCHILREDPDLAEAIAPAQRSEAIEACTAPEVRIPAGRWATLRVTALGDGIGFLVLSGLMIRRVGIEGRFGAELIGQGDMLRPPSDEESQTLPVTTGWSVVEPTRLAVLDERFAHLLASYPQLTGRLVGRAIQRSRNLAVNMAIVHQARVDARLRMLFWHLAGRWGRVRGDGVALPLRLTHTILAELVAARRPTVTSALSELARRGEVRLVDDVWLLTGRPPGDPQDLGPRLLGRGTRTRSERGRSTI